MEKQKPWPIGPQKDINIEGAIKYMKEMRSICDTDDGFVPQVYDMAIAALRRAESENKPLTLEQLREMYGEPVWIVDGNVHCWMIVERADSWLMHFAEKENCGVGLPFAGYGKTWIAYRRKPEGSTAP